MNEYPTDEELKTIETWKITDEQSIHDLFEYIQSLWIYDNYFQMDVPDIDYEKCWDNMIEWINNLIDEYENNKIMEPLTQLLMTIERKMQYFTEKQQHENGDKICISTGGWSGHETIISAMEKNKLLMLHCYYKWRCGGHFEFKIPGIKKKEDEKTSRES